MDLIALPLTQGTLRRCGPLCAVVGLWLGSCVPLSAEERCAVLEVFVRADAERSQAARQFIEKTYGKRPGLLVRMRDVVASESDLDRYWQLMDHYKVPKPRLPAFHVSGLIEQGWDPAATPDHLDEMLTVEVFVRDGCTRCQAAHPVLFEQLPPRYPGYRFVRRSLEQSAGAAGRLQELSQRYRVQATSVPAVHFCGRLMVGFIDTETSFRQWDNVLKAVTVPCKPPAPKPVPEPGRRREQSSVPLNSIWLGAALIGSDPHPASADQPLPNAENVIESPDEGPVGDVNVDDAPPPRRPTRRELPDELDESETHPLAPTADSDLVSLPLLGEINWRDWGLPAFTIIVGLLDGFNPCAMWVLLFLLSLLVNLRDRWKILAVAGTFVLISGLAYLAFMAAWLNVFQLIGLLRPVQIVLGLIGISVGAIHIKDFFAFKQGISLSIPESAKPGLYDRMRRIVMAETLRTAIFGATVLAVLVNIVELLCTAGLPAMYTSILTLQQLPPWQNYAYLLLYIVCYMLDDALMVTIVVVTLGRYKLQERGGRILKLVSGIVILAIGLVMLFRPGWLD